MAIFSKISVFYLKFNKIKSVNLVSVSNSKKSKFEAFCKKLTNLYKNCSLFSKKTVIFS